MSNDHNIASSFRVKDDGTLISSMQDAENFAQETTLSNIDGKVATQAELEAVKAELETIKANQTNGEQLVQQSGSADFTHGELDVGTAGTAENFPNEPCREATITAKLDNTGKIYIGDEIVSDTSFGVYLEAGDSFTVSVSNLNQIYIDADNNGEGVRVLYV